MAGSFVCVTLCFTHDAAYKTSSKTKLRIRQFCGWRAKAAIWIEQRLSRFSSPFVFVSSHSLYFIFIPLVRPFHFFFFPPFLHPFYLSSLFLFIHSFFFLFSLFPLPPSLHGNVLQLVSSTKLARYTSRYHDVISVPSRPCPIFGTQRRSLIHILEHLQARQ